MALNHDNDNMQLVNSSARRTTSENERGQIGARRTERGCGKLAFRFGRLFHVSASPLRASLRFFFFGFIDIHVTSWKRWAGEDELNQGVSLVVGKFMIDRTV